MKEFAINLKFSSMSSESVNALLINDYQIL